MSRQFNFMPSRYAGAADAGNPASPSRTAVASQARGKRGRRSAETFQADYRARHLLEGLGQLRVTGRHAADAVSESVLGAFFAEYGVPSEQGRAAYEAGQQDRARGVPCMCNRCAGRILEPGSAQFQDERK